MSEDREGKMMWFKNNPELKTGVDKIAINDLKNRFEKAEDFMDFEKGDRLIFINSLLKLEREFCVDHGVEGAGGSVKYTFSDADTEMAKLVFQVMSALERAHKQKFDVREEKALMMAQVRDRTVKKYRDIFEEFVTRRK